MTPPNMEDIYHFMSNIPFFSSFKEKVSCLLGDLALLIMFLFISLVWIIYVFKNFLVFVLFRSPLKDF